LFPGSFQNPDIAPAIFQRHPGLALLPDGLDKIHYLSDERIGRLVPYGPTVTIDATSLRARAKYILSDNRAVFTVQF
jgi:hypothetical protein